MNLIGSVNITLEKGNQEILLSFAQPKSNKEAMGRAENSINLELPKGAKVTEVRRQAPQYGANSWSAYAGNKHVAWITLNEVTVPG
jgi:hypothetical protein